MEKKWILGVIAGIMLLLTTCATPSPTNTPEPTSTSTNTPTVEPTATPTVEPGTVRTLEDVKKAMIRIEAQGSFVSPAGEQMRTAGSGSGFIIDPSGIAVTNNHVVSGAALLQVWVGEESEPRNAKIIGVSECSDLAVIDLEGDGYAYLKWYDGEVKTGLAVYAAGFPLGDPEFTLTSGIVSKEQANGETAWASVDAVIEHDATINPGSSGGPLVTKEGQVVAVNYASRSDVNQYFAIAGDKALEIIELLRDGKDVDSIGLNPQALGAGSAISGIWTSSVKSGSPADKAGIKAGDVIVQLEGWPIATDGTMSDYCDILRSHDLEKDTINVQVVRFSTGEVWEGQINGRELTIYSSPTVVAPTRSATPEYTRYVRITDDLQAIVLEVPEEWSDIDGSPYTNSEGQMLAASLIASRDVDEFESYEAPGVYFMAMESEPGEFDADEILDQVDQSDKCTHEGRFDYRDQLYTGRSDLYADCSGASSMLLVVAAAPEEQSFFTIVMIQVMNEDDLAEVANHIFDTFQVVGDLPSSGGGTTGTDTFVLVIDNQSPDPVCHLYITDGDSLGDDWLQSRRIASGDTWAVELPISEYVVVAQDCEEAHMGVFFGIAADTALTIGGPGRNISLRLKNESGSDICSVFISPSTSDTWGEDWLERARLANGKHWIFYIEPGVYDLLARDCSDNDLQQVSNTLFDEDKIWTITDQD